MGNNIKVKQKEDLHSLYRDIIISTNTLIWRTDIEGRFIFVNPAWEKSYAYKAEEMLGTPLSHFQLPGASEHYVSAFRNCLIGESIIGHETSFLAKNGDEVFLAINMTPYYDATGTVAGIQGIAFDITEHKIADSLLQYINAKDELTGLYNLHTFLSMTEQQIKTASREKKHMLIIYAGVDGTQTINELYGNEAGDRILIDAADILRKTFREADVLARTGGDEFVISTLVASRETEDIIMARLNQNIGEYNARNNNSFKLSMSVGTSLYNPEQHISIEEALSVADDKMHEIKKNKKV